MRIWPVRFDAEERANTADCLSRVPVEWLLGKETSLGCVVLLLALRESVRLNMVPALMVVTASAWVALRTGKWTRQPGSHCTEISQPGVVTGVLSAQVVEVDGTPWHVGDVRHRSGP